MKKIFSKIYVGLIMLFLYAPIFVLILYSFNDAKSSVWKGFTLKWYTELFADSMLMKALSNTIIVALLSSIIATIIGTMAAIGIRNFKGRKKALIMNVSNIPIMNPEIVTGVSFMLLFVFFAGYLGFEMGFGTVLIAHISFSIPYVILNVTPKLNQTNKNIYEAAMDLGCNPVLAFRKVVIPEILPGIISGFLMAFTFSLDDFIITYFTRGASFETLPIAIYTMLRRRISPTINALSAIMFVTILILLILVNFKDLRTKEKRDR